MGAIGTCQFLSHGPGLGNLYVQALAEPQLICRQGSGWASLAKRSVRERWLCWLRAQAGPCRPAYTQSAWGLPAVWQHLTGVCQAGRLYGQCRQRADKDMHRKGERACSASASARKVAAPSHAGAALPTIIVTRQQAVVVGVSGTWLGCSRPQRGAPCGITRRRSKGLLAECELVCRSRYVLQGWEQAGAECVLLAARAACQSCVPYTVPPSRGMRRDMHEAKSPSRQLLQALVRWNLVTAGPCAFHCRGGSKVHLRVPAGDCEQCAATPGCLHTTRERP